MTQSSDQKFLERYSKNILTELNIWKWIHTPKAKVRLNNINDGVTRASAANKTAGGNPQALKPKRFFAGKKLTHLL